MPEHVYIMGSARSGTTLLSIILGAHPALRAGGEILHFPVYWAERRRCSCAAPVDSCERWRKAGAVIGGADSAAVRAHRHAAEAAERHLKTLPYLLAPSTIPCGYLQEQEAIFAALKEEGKGVVDESKYVARALALSRLERERFRFIYIVRDCRGVLYSFSKNVQKPRLLLSAAAYYFFVNLAAQLAVWTRLRGRAIKVRYEDLVAAPRQELTRIGDFLGLDMSEVISKIENRQPLAVGHLVSGNRIRGKGDIVVKADSDWQRSYKGFRRGLAYVLCLPFQLLNRYPV